MRLTGVFAGRGPKLEIGAEVVERRGCDRAPLDPAKDDDRLTLRACVWADHAARFGLLDAALASAASDDVAIARAGAAEWLESQLAEPRPGVATVVYESLVWQYLSDDERTRVADVFAAAGARASAPLAWMRMEPGGELANVHLHRWPEDEDALVARAGLPRAPGPLARGRGYSPGMIEVLDTDITGLEVDAIANAANTQLAHGGGVAAAIARAAGHALELESRERAPIGLGEAVETTAGELPARWVIHAATMELDGRTSADIIRRATASTLTKADELGAESLALVAFGTGVGGFPVEEAARIEVEEVRRHLKAGSGLRRVVFAVRGRRARQALERFLGSD